MNTPGPTGDTPEQQLTRAAQALTGAARDLDASVDVLPGPLRAQGHALASEARHLGGRIQGVRPGDYQAAAAAVEQLWRKYESLFAGSRTLRLANAGAQLDIARQSMPAPQQRSVNIRHTGPAPQTEPSQSTRQVRATVRSADTTATPRRSAF